jgi:MFS family permease
MLLIVACLCLACALGSGVLLPRTTPHRERSYFATLASMPRLLLSHADLRTSAVSGALWFFAFSLIWMGLSLALALPPLGLSPTVIGLYALAGVAGIFATRAAGQLADRFGSRPIVLAGLALALACTLAMPFTLAVAPLMLMALALFDTGLFSAQVANQRQVLSIAPRQPAPFNSVYMVTYFVGGSLGTALGGPLVSTFGWPVVAIAAAMAITTAGVMSLIGGRTPLDGPRHRSAGLVADVHQLVVATRVHILMSGAGDGQQQADRDGGDCGEGEEGLDGGGHGGGFRFIGAAGMGGRLATNMVAVCRRSRGRPPGISKFADHGFSSLSDRIWEREAGTPGGGSRAASFARPFPDGWPLPALAPRSEPARPKALIGGRLTAALVGYLFGVILLGAWLASRSAGGSWPT